MGVTPEVRTGTWIAAAGLAAGLALGAGAAVVANDQDTPPEKEEAIANATPVPDTPGPSDEATVRPATPDSGTPAQIAQVKANVNRMMDAYWAAMALPSDLAARADAVRNNQKERRDILRGVWARNVQDMQIQEVEIALNEVANDDTYEAYSMSRFTVTEWQGVSVADGVAEATLTGYPEFLVPGTGWRKGATSQFQISMLKAGPGASDWRMTKRVYLVLGGAG